MREEVEGKRCTKVTGVCTGAGGIASASPARFSLELLNLSCLLLPLGMSLYPDPGPSPCHQAKVPSSCGVNP